MREFEVYDVTGVKVGTVKGDRIVCKDDFITINSSTEKNTIYAVFPKSYSVIDKEMLTEDTDYKGVKRTYVTR